MAWLSSATFAIGPVIDFILTLALALIYFGGFVLAQTTLRVVVGQESSP
jgi:hypothetical protein